METCWSTLPEHLLDLIVQRLSLPDRFRFGCVCKPWRSVCGLLQFQNHHPLLMIVPHPTRTTSSEDVGFYSLCDGKIYKADILELSNRRICGSNFGFWLMSVQNNRVELFIPFSKFVVRLPLLSTSRNYAFNPFHKVAISASPFINGTMIAAIEDGRRNLVFLRIGENQQGWTPLRYRGEHNLGLDDLTYYKGKFYAVRSKGREVVVIRGINSQKTLPYGARVTRLPREYENAYILEASGDLLVVLRYLIMDKHPHTTIGFKVLKLKFGISNKLVEIHSLGDRSLFLGYNSSFSISSSDFSGCKPNCIYFTDNIGYYSFQNRHRGHDQGIFNLEDGSIEKFLYPTDNVIVMPPVWFTPYKTYCTLLVKAVVE